MQTDKKKYELEVREKEEMINIGRAMRHDHTMNAIHRILEFPLHDLMQSIDKIGHVAYFVYDKW